jgi:hypothetical protein
MGTFKFDKSAWITLSALLLISCGPHVGGAKPKTDPSLELTEEPTSAYLFSNSGCAGNAPNILPKVDWYNDGGMRFIGCRTTDVESFKIVGRPSIGTRICVIPAYMGSNGFADYWRNPATGEPYSSCAESSTTEGVEFKFRGTTTNYAYVVEESNLLQMKTCLMNGNPGTCPYAGNATYSRGKFTNQ